MNWTIRVSNTPPLVRVTLRGLFEMNEFRRMVGSVVAAIDDLAFRPVLFDEREFNMSQVTLSDMLQVRGMVTSNNLAFVCRKVAILESSAPAFALAAPSYRQVYIPKAIAVIAVFGDEQESLAWLAEASSS